MIHGRNELPPDEPKPLWKLIAEQFDDLLVKILLAAAVVDFLIALWEGERGIKAVIEPGVILTILIANAAVGVITEGNAEKAIEALKQYEAESAHIIRGGRQAVVPADDLVPGDIVEVSVGDKASSLCIFCTAAAGGFCYACGGGANFEKLTIFLIKFLLKKFNKLSKTKQVPADCRVVEIYTTRLQVDQSILTGESHAVEKQVEVRGEGGRAESFYLLYGEGGFFFTVLTYAFYKLASVSPLFWTKDY